MSVNAAVILDEPLDISTVAREVMFYKIYHDKGHYVGTPIVTGEKKKKMRSFSEERPEKTYARQIYKEQLRRGCRHALAKSHAMAAVIEKYGEDQNDISDLKDAASNGADAEMVALSMRKKRFWRKAFLNEWTHFATFTYADNKVDGEEDFRARLNKKLSNLHSRRGWNYAGVWERGDLNGRLHFHALIYVPSGQMVGKLTRKVNYKCKCGVVKEVYSNSEFENDFGLTDFSPINPDEFARAVNYIGGYLGKTNDRVRYSRGIPTEIIAPIRPVNIFSEFSDINCTKSIFFDDTMDWEKCVHAYNRHIEKQARAGILRPEIYLESA